MSVFRLCAILIAMWLAPTVLQGRATAEEPAKPKDRVVALYFHRTERCPTCKKMGSYTEEAITSAFQDQLKSKTVEFHYVDFQDKRIRRWPRVTKSQDQH